MAFRGHSNDAPASRCYSEEFGARDPWNARADRPTSDNLHGRHLPWKSLTRYIRLVKFGVWRVWGRGLVGMAINTNSRQCIPAPLIFLFPVFLHSQARSLSAADSWESSLINYSSASYRHPPGRMANIFARVCTKLTPILFRALDPSGLAVSVARKVPRAWHRDVLTTLSNLSSHAGTFQIFLLASPRGPMRICNWVKLHAKRPPTPSMIWNWINLVWRF